MFSFDEEELSLLRVYSLEVYNLGSRIQGLGSRDLDVEFQPWALGFRSRF